MQQGLFGHDSHSTYSRLNAALSEFREASHRDGRFNDSNAKLDELVKVVATYVAYKTNQIPSFPFPETMPAGSLLAALQQSFEAAAALPCYRDGGGNPVFGKDPRLTFEERDLHLAVLMVRLVVESFGQMPGEIAGYDPLNEAFGHFVRDNFRGHIEDAQYLTPGEVVSFVVDLALDEIAAQGAGEARTVIVADTCCGVGSFLATFASRARQHPDVMRRGLTLLGQDKVDRMVRLSVVNLALFAAVEHNICWGNSLHAGGVLDEHRGQVDLILTNPPFGARFTSEDIARAGELVFPIYSGIATPGQSVDSELLFVDRNLALLRPGGHLIIVVPDGVVSARGQAALLRQQLRGRARVCAVVELPKVTFAQAGTQTKTVILHLQKEVPSSKAAEARVFIARAADLGFQVSRRKGAAVKVIEGRDDLPLVLEIIRAARSASPAAGAVVHSDEPRCVSLPHDEFVSGTWTPAFHSPTRLRSIAALSSQSGSAAVPLSELAELGSGERSTRTFQEGDRFISVLHILGEGLVDVEGMLRHRPITPGLPVSPGEVILSKINPRIPRVAVVPEVPGRLLCSSEFEILVPKTGVNAYMLTFLLLSPQVQAQVQAMTSGTSASHNRVRASELRNVLVPIPRRGTEGERRLSATVRDYERESRALFSATWRLSELRRAAENWPQ